MKKLLERSTIITQLVATDYIREIMQQIEWSFRLVAIRGARGVGKTTLLRQHLKLNYGASETALYVSLDDFYFTENRLFELAEQFSQQGGQQLYLDEVHKYPKGNWAQEIKNIYDFLPDLKVVFTGSSILKILNEQADLSRRALVYDMQGFSFREYLDVVLKIQLPSYSLATILQDHRAIASNIVLERKIKPLVLLNDYLQYGYYPFFLESQKAYWSRVTEMLKLVIEVDFSYLEDYTITNHTKINHLLYAIASSAPFKPNISKLSSKLVLNRNRLTQYIYLLERARLINLLHSDRTGISALQKPEKIFLENTNLMYALAPAGIQKGSLRETFFFSHLRYAVQQSPGLTQQIFYPDRGDFLVDTFAEQISFEVGGRNKGRQQLADADNGYLVIDDMEIGTAHRIPLWLFGFLY